MCTCPPSTWVIDILTYVTGKACQAANTTVTITHQNIVVLKTMQPGRSLKFDHNVYFALPNLFLAALELGREELGGRGGHKQGQALQEVWFPQSVGSQAEPLQQDQEVILTGSQQRKATSENIQSKIIMHAWDLTSDATCTFPRQD